MQTSDAQAREALNSGRSARHVMVIFGAGASFDSISDLGRRAEVIAPAGERVSRALAAPYHDRLDWRPPLTRDLFGTRRRFQEALGHYRGAGVLVDNRLRDLDPKTSTVEEVLDEIAEQAFRSERSEGSESLRRQLTSLRFYLREVLWECGRQYEFEIAPAQTNYYRIVEQLVRWQEGTPGSTVSLVTFNYDLMLDRAVSAHARLDLRDIRGYTGRENFKLFKPHGSVNWVRLTDEPLPPPFADMPPEKLREHFQHLAQLVIDLAGADPEGLPAKGSDWRVTWEEESDWRDITHRVDRKRVMLGFPALTVPITSKDRFEFPESHEAQLRASMKSVTHLLTIGWRASEANFLALWRSAEATHRPMIQVVTQGATSAQAVADTFLKAGIASQACAPVTGGFSSYADRSGVNLQTFLDRPLPGL